MSAVAGQMPGLTGEDRSLAEVALLRRCRQLSARVENLTIDAGANRELVGLTLIGRGGDEIVAGLSRLEPLARRTVWNMTASFAFDPSEPTFALNERSRARGIDLTQILSARTIHENPLLTSLFPDVLVGPVHLQTILIDQVGAVLPGRCMPSGDSAAWLVTRPDLVAEVRRIWFETVRLSTPALHGRALAPLTERQCEVACRMAAGAKDAVIARELSISARTVGTEVDAVLQFLGTTSRCEAGLVMRGRSPNGRAPSVQRPELSSAASKLGAANRHEAVHLARSHGWI